MKIVLLGAPGSGKGTQASRISEKYNLPHISTGDIFREITNSGTALGNKIKEIIDGGNLCPDNLTVEIVKERLSRSDCANGYILDGFPRDIAQAKALESFGDPNPDFVINLDVDLSKIEKRITGRRNCKKCRNSFHIDHIGETKVCPNCGGELIVREDDNPESVKERLKVYKKSTEPLVAYYKEKGQLVSIDGDKPIDQVFDEIVKVLG